MHTPLSYIEISRNNLIHNFNQIRSLVHPNTKIVSVVKANAYGHGLKEIVSLLENLTDYFQVDDIIELREVRKISKKPILVLGYVAIGDLEEALKLDAILAIYDEHRLNKINNIAKKYKKSALVHIKIDAYLGRQGIMLSEIDSFAEKIKTYEYIKVDGIYSHFANIEDTKDFSHAQKQITAYEKALEIFKIHGFTNVLNHISATSGILAYEKGTGKNNLVRLGIGLYGMWPSVDLKQTYQKAVNFKPVIRWISHIAQLKNVPKAYPIGYGLTYITKRPTRLAIIPQGYSDGYDRGLSNKGHVLIHGKKCKILGRVAMNMFAVDVTKIHEVKVEDEVVILGSQKNERISAEEIANQIGTINYEVTTRISPLLPRLLSDDD